jgi:hypothetical protein
MPPLTDERTRGNVVREWISGFPRDQIAEHTGIGAGTVSSIIANYKAGLDDLDFDSIRQLAVEARQHNWNFADLASHARLYNYFLKSGTAEDKIESFISNVSSNDISPEKMIELVYQLYEISKVESIPLDQVSAYIGKKLEEKQKIDEQIHQADATLQSKNVTIEAINQHLKLSEELDKHGLSAKDTDKVLNLLINAREYQFNVKKIARKLRGIQRLEKKEKQLRGRCEIFTKQAAKYKNILPLVEEISALQIGVEELIAFKIAINQAVKYYDLSPLTCTLRLIDDIKKYNKIDGLKKELSSLYLQKHTVDQVCFSQNKSMRALINLQSLGITEDRILELNYFLENNVYNSYRSTK